MKNEKRICPVCGKNEIKFDWKKMCDECEHEKYEMDLVDMLSSNEITETRGEDFVYCPWCGAKQDIEEDHEAHIDGKFEKKCSCCGKGFILTTYVEYFYSTCRISDKKTGDK